MARWGVIAGLAAALITFQTRVGWTAEPPSSGETKPTQGSGSKPVDAGKVEGAAASKSKTKKEDAPQGHPQGEQPGGHPGHEKGHEGMMEHPGEHPGEKAKKGSSLEIRFGAEDIKVAMRTHITEKTRSDGGVFRIRDEKEGKGLELNFVKIHDPVREVKERGYFACTDFSTSDGKNVYDIDFWLKPSGGKLVVTETVIHKKDGVARFTYENDRPVALN